MKRLPLTFREDPLPRLSDRAVRRLSGEAHARDTLVVEEPLEIRLGAEPIAVTMRTPGDDLDLAAGFLFTEAVLRSFDDVASIAHSRRAEDAERRNVVEVTPVAGLALDVSKARRSFYAASSCGMCGKSSIDAIHVQVAAAGPPDPTTFSRALLESLPPAMRAAQPSFDASGGLHAAALFDEHGALVVAREDIGRHNAVDKVIGHMVRNRRVPLRGHALMVSGRAGFEIVQKAAVARIPLVCAVSAASSLAVDLAERTGMTLVGFLRPPNASIYTHPERIV